VNNGNWPVGFELCEKGFTRAFHYKGGKDGHPVIMVCGYGMNLAKRIGNLYAIGNNNVKDFSTAEFAGKPKRDINIWGITATGMMFHELWHILDGRRPPFPRLVGVELIECVLVVDEDLTTPVKGPTGVDLTAGYYWEGSTALVVQDLSKVATNVDNHCWLGIGKLEVSRYLH